MSVGDGQQPIRWRQGSNYHVGSHEVGVMNIWDEEPGVPVAQLSVYDATRADDAAHRVHVGDGVTVGDVSYRVVQIAPASGGSSGWLEVEPVWPRAGGPLRRLRHALSRFA